MDNPLLDYLVKELYFAVMIGAGYWGVRRARSARRVRRDAIEKEWAPDARAPRREASSGISRKFLVDPASIVRLGACS